MNRQAQSTIEFTLVFVITILLIVLTANVFVWLNHSVVGRQVAYENTRTEAGTPNDTSAGKSDFFTLENKKLKKLNVFVPGGYSAQK